MLKRAISIVAISVATAAPIAGQNPNALVGDGLLGYVATTIPPQVTCAGGEPTGGYPPCSGDTKHILTRGEVQTWGAVAVSDAIAPLLDGPLTMVVNCNFNANYSGVCWGTFSWQSTGGGTWEGHWTTPVMDLLTYESKLSMTGFGVGGPIDGKQLTLEGSSNPGDWFIAFRASIH